MNEEQLLRYSRQMMLPEIDAEGQLKLAASKVLIIGLGGLGSSASMYLCSGGVGELTLVDFDTVEISNLQRQIVHTTPNIGKLKVVSAKQQLTALNPDTVINTIEQKLDAETLSDLIKQHDIVLDCSDNFETRFTINQACVDNKKPLVSAAAIRFEAQISVFDQNIAASPCYRCLYDENSFTDQTCAANGVIAPLLGIVGSIQALEAMKLIMGIGNVLVGKLMLIDALSMEWRTVKLNKDALCPICSA